MKAVLDTVQTKAGELDTTGACVMLDKEANVVEQIDKLDDRNVKIEIRLKSNLITL